MKKIILLFAISLYIMIDSNGYAQEPPKDYLINSIFTWTDNGNYLGTITFTSDSIAHPTWTDLPNKWKLEPNNDLLVLTNGTQYVARLKWDSATQTYSGGRDVSSQTQDGVFTVMGKAKKISKDFLFNAIFTWTDNGNYLGTITFTADGIAHPIWTDLPNKWKLEPNNDLLILTNGTQYVARLKWDNATQTYRGGRDVSSQTQDGVFTVMKKKQETQSYLSKEIKEKGFVNIYGICFNSNKDTPNSESETTLNELASFITSNPELKFEIIGHTDSDGEIKENNDLSLRRSQSIINWLKSKDVNVSNLSVSGLGESSPVVSNKTESEKALNRRIEIKVIK